jgi:hypothetical protein
MKGGFDIYGHKEQIEAALRKLEKEKINATNRETIKRFYRKKR